MLGFLLTVACVAIWGLIGVGVLAEVRRQTVGDLLRGIGQGVGSAWETIRAAPRRHPMPLWAAAESVFWLLLLIPLLDDLLNPYNSQTAYWVWSLTIIPHEAGHVICSPFGWVLTIAGGSIWQLLAWALLGGYALVYKRQVGLGLLCWMMVGHSFINLSVYIRDASDRNLPLLFGAGKDHHDWWNLLGRFGLLDYDWLLADVAMSIGGLVALAAILLGVLSAWLLPRRRGQRGRFGGA